MNEAFDREEMAWLARDIVEEECLAMQLEGLVGHLEARQIDMYFDDMRELLDMINHEMKIEVALHD